MEKYLTSAKTGDDIDKYLTKVFGGFSSPGEVDADLWQAKLGVPVSLDDLDLIYTLKAIAAEEPTIPSTGENGEAWRTKTQCFLGAIQDMRGEMERRLRQSVMDLEAAGLPDFEALRKTMARTLLPDDLRRQVIGHAIVYCHKMTDDRVGGSKKSEAAETERISNKAARTNATYQLLHVFFTPFLLSICLTVDIDRATLAPLCVGAFITGMVLPFFAASIEPKTYLLDAFKRFASKPQLPNATLLQRVRFLGFKLAYTPPPLSLISQLFVVLSVVTIALAPFLSAHMHGRVLLIIYYGMCGVALGKRIWSCVRYSKEPRS